MTSLVFVLNFHRNQSDSLKQFFCQIDAFWWEISRCTWLARLLAIYQLKVDSQPSADLFQVLRSAGSLLVFKDCLALYEIPRSKISSLNRLGIFLWQIIQSSEKLYIGHFQTLFCRDTRKSIFSQISPAQCTLLMSSSNHFEAIALYGLRLVKEGFWYDEK